MSKESKNQSELYMDHIVESLVRHKASILVGAGFSRNALPANESVKGSMPLWNQLTDQFYKLLDLEGSKEYLSPLTIAQEVEEMYDRPFLDSMIMSAMNDEHYRPAPIYSNLLALNWNNIFTTNYDRLLEWALDQYEAANYVVIRDEKDLLLSSKEKKIIKLHGSFPSNGPYIITEEDYRTYPKKHAIFVNTVQQALIEDTFCLIGFSGTDPNFLNWIGWIHDNLSIENSPLIYMIVDKEKSKAETKNLLSKKIGLVILDELDGYKEMDTNKKYEKFITDLKRRVDEKEDAFKYWDQIDGKQVRYDPGKAKNDEEKLKNEEKFYKDLKTIHEYYPGWIFLPHPEINKVKILIDNINQYFINKGPKHFLIEICFEYCWLHEISGTLIYNDHRLEMMVKEYLEGNHDSENDDYIQHILIQLLRSYRYDFAFEKWKECYELLDQFEQKSREISNVLAYEKVLFHIYSFDFDDALRCLYTIQLDSVPDIWSMRKAALLATFGKYDESLAILGDYLKRCHNILNREQSVHDFYYSSVESCGFYLYRYIEQTYNQAKELDSIMNEKVNSNYTNSDGDELKDTKEHPKIWQYDFIWSEENDLYFNEILQKCQRKNENKHGFDVDYTLLGISSSSDEGFEIAMRFLAFREMTAIPFKIGMTTSKYGVLNVAKHLGYYYPQLPVLLAVLSEDSKVIDAVFTKDYLSKLNRDDINLLFEICNKAFMYSCERILTNKILYYKHSLTEYPLEVMIELSSKLVSKYSKDYLEYICQMITIFYKIHDFVQYDPSKMIKKIIKTIPLEDLIEKIAVFYKLPLIEDDLIKYTKFPDCTCLIASRYNGVKLKMDADAKAQFYFLINQAQDQSFQKAAVDRLIAMSKIFRLNEEQQHRLSNIIDNENNLNLKETDKLEQLIKQWNDIVASLTKCVNENYFTGNWRINLSKANSLIEKIPPEMIIVSNLIDILNKLCKKLVEDNGHTSEYIKSLTKPMNDMTLSSVAMLIGKALLLVNYSQSNNKDQRVEEDIREIKETMDQNNVSYYLIVYSTNREAFKKYFSDQLQSTENQNVFDACETLVFLSDRSKGDEFNSLVDIVIEHLFGGIDFETSRYVFTLNRLVKKDKISNDKIRNILKILARLNNITAYNSGNSDLIDEKINIRSSCCSLAYNLYHAKYLNAKKLPEEIEIWKSIAQDDNEFTEVRNAWNDQEYLYDISLENRKQV